MKFHALFSLLAVSTFAAPFLQKRATLDSSDGPKTLENAYKQRGKAYENALKEFGKQTGRSGQDLTKAYQEYAKAVGQLASDASEL
jgi:hypothetical protein